ncbi:MAG: hypothetical protein L6Q37_06865 [Bdellovibrionaceae bacterium]|nr:hypothetical protein [Pseudobdellovibrionaceae bacterium]NUM59764.1 hypothetical protein [Pseudobdellovibrionaceae bacterium]
MRYKILISCLLLLVLKTLATSEPDDHDHQTNHSNENSQVGPNKGILSADDTLGFQLSPSAEKNFEIEKMKVSINHSVNIPKTAILSTGTEQNIFRIRNSYFKRVDFQIIKKNKDKIIINSDELQLGDEVALTGLGFLRIAEITAFGGAPEGHSH